MPFPPDKLAQIMKEYECSELTAQAIYNEDLLNQRLRIMEVDIASLKLDVVSITKSLKAISSYLGTVDKACREGK